MILQGRPLLPLLHQAVPLRVLPPWLEPLSKLRLDARRRLRNDLRRLGRDGLLRLGRRTRREVLLGSRCLVHGVIHFIRNLASRLLELFNASAQTLGQLRQSLSAKQNQNDRQDQNNLPATEHACKHNIHKSSKVTTEYVKPSRDPSKA